MKKLLEFLQDNGVYSSTRLFLLIVVLCFSFHWIYSVIYYNGFNPSIELLAFVTSILGLKVLEKKK